MWCGGRGGGLSVPPGHGRRDGVQAVPGGHEGRPLALPETPLQLLHQLSSGPE